MDAFIGEIRLFAGDYAPQDWEFCCGQSVPIRLYTALYALIGITYGGDGQTTFCLPDLSGKVPMGTGQGPNLTWRKLGSVIGDEAVTLTNSQMPAHTHDINGRSGTALPTGKNDPNGNLWRDGGVMKNFSAGSPNVPMAAQIVMPSLGDGKPHYNVQPCVGIHYIICTQGNFPEFD